MSQYTSHTTHINILAPGICDVILKLAYSRRDNAVQYNDISYSTAFSEADYKSACQITNYAPHLNLTDAL